MIARTDTDKQGLRASGAMLARILRDVAERAVPGASALELDRFAREEIEAGGAVPIFLGYEAEGSTRPYPATICVSINDAVVHGIPKAEAIIAEGDVVSLDCGLSYQGYVADAAVTVIAGKGDEDAKRLARGAREALEAGIRAAAPGAFTGDIGSAVSRVADAYGLSVVRDLGGHGTGKKLHEEPYVANFGTPGKGGKLVPGMVLALEPIFTLGKGGIKLASDEWTYLTRDGSRAAHFEHTIIVSEHGAEVVTRL